MTEQEAGTDLDGLGWVERELNVLLATACAPSFGYRDDFEASWHRLTYYVRNRSAGLSVERAVELAKRQPTTRTAPPKPNQSRT